jgi:hypothetical protein
MTHAVEQVKYLVDHDFFKGKVKYLLDRFFRGKLMFKVRRIFVKAICLFIPRRKWRRGIRRHFEI